MKTRPFLIIFSACLLLTILGCGPDSIFIRQGLDTPSHHVSNGNQFMNSDKFDAAQAEFDRALELDPNYAPAYVGLGLVAGHRGETENAMALMEKARRLAQDEEQRQHVEVGFEKLTEMAAGN
jgi:tetratricopeptide (TPR) repeat protein